MRFVSYELSLPTKLTTDKWSVPFSSYSSKTLRKKKKTAKLHYFQNKAVLSGCLIFLSHHATCNLDVIFGHALPRLESPLPSLLILHRMIITLGGRDINLNTLKLIFLAETGKDKNCISLANYCRAGNKHRLAHFPILYWNLNHYHCMLGTTVHLLFLAEKNFS